MSNRLAEHGLGPMGYSSWAWPDGSTVGLLLESSLVDLEAYVAMLHHCIPVAANLL